MDPDAFTRALVDCDQEIAELDHSIATLQAALKDAKKAREEAVAKLRGTIRDQARPLFQAAEEASANGDEPTPRRPRTRHAAL